MAEAIGIALAVLPLVISAIEHYDKCVQPFMKYRHFTSRARYFQQKINAQRTIFRNQCRLLLLDVVEHDVVNEMMIDQRHPHWSDAQLDRELKAQLQASQESCAGVLQEIGCILGRLGKWADQLESALQESENKNGNKAWRSVVRTKLKLSLRDSILQEAVEELKEWNDSFLTLSSQTSKLFKEEAKSKSVVKPHAKDISKVKSIQEASRKVYEALGHCCSKHAEHRTHFCLEAKISGSPDNPQIKFKVSFARCPIRGATDLCEPVFFVIESIGSSATTEEVIGVFKALKRGINDQSASSAKKIKLGRSVRFQDIASQGVCQMLPEGQSENLRDLCMSQNFCDRLRECLQRASGGLQYIGTLGNTIPYKHFVHFPETRKRRPALSLQEIITISSRQGPESRLSIEERVHLARSLAIAVLQYHATPWLRNPWRCKDIYFFDAEERIILQRSTAPISEPHIDVPIKKSSLVSVPPGPAEHLAPNIILFNLGIMLIELAFTATLQNLLNQKEQSYRDSQYTEFFAARRLSNVVSREMGPRYGKIVQKCLGCHFASGADLSNSELQAEYYRDVVKELEKLEEDFSSLSIT